MWQMPLSAMRFSSPDGSDKTEQVLAALKAADPDLSAYLVRRTQKHQISICWVRLVMVKHCTAAMRMAPGRVSVFSQITGVETESV